MQIELANPLDRMSESGSSLLRLIQNNNTPRLDLLVRESLQNCLDAGKSGVDYVRVDYIVHNVSTEKIASLFAGIDTHLLKKYPGEHTIIAIRDSNTEGLTGPVKLSDVKNNKYGNYLKLVSEISKPQERSGAGGSWGLGKTVFFRIGIGLVIYYSRIKTSQGEYESRFSAAYIEDETRPDPLLPDLGTGVRRGIAWWGDRPLMRSLQSQTVPVTNERRINRILEKFGVPCYSGEETGTTIIIPFVNEDELLRETWTDDQEAAGTVPYWCKTSLTDYLNVAFQRWYAPRINNLHYNGQYLEISINGEKLTTDEMAPVFQLIQKLYNTRPEEPGDFAGSSIYSKKIEIRNRLKNTSTAGWINYIKVTSKELKMEAPDNLPSPYQYINKLSTDTMYNDPIVLYTRKPGMIVSYSVTGDWTDNIPKTGPGEYIIAIFVVNSENVLSQNDMSLEDYVRGSEKADHMVWDDWSPRCGNPQIIDRIKRQVRKKIKDDFSKITTGGVEKKNLGLGKMLADILLPPSDLAYWDDAFGGSQGQGGTGGDGSTEQGEPPVPVNRTSHVILKQSGELEFSEDTVIVPIQIQFGKKRFAYLELGVESEKGIISSGEWERNVLTPFPVKLKKFELKSIRRGIRKNRKNILEDTVIFERKSTESGVSIDFRVTDSFGIQDGIEISVPSSDNYVLDGRLYYEPHDVQGSINIKEEK